MKLSEFWKFAIRNGRKIYCLVSKDKYILLVPVESKAKIRGKAVDIKIKDTKNPFESIRLLAC